MASGTNGKAEALVEKLSDRNYQTWKIEMKWFLKGKGLLDYALGKIELGEGISREEGSPDERR
jgi:hypothetical protein